MHLSDTKVNFIGILGILGAILMIVCVFLEWGSIEMTILGEKGVYGFSGWGLYSDAAIYETDFLGQHFSINLSDLDLTDYTYVPLVALVCGIVGLIATVLPVASKSGVISKLFGFIALILAIVSIVLMVMYNSDLSYSGGYEGLATATVSASYGLWIGMAGAVLMVLGGIGDLARKTR